MRPIEVSSYIGRTQDISLLKQAEDSKPTIQQQSFAQSFEKQIDSRMEQVRHKDDADFETPLDENGKGNNQYHGQKRKKKEEEEDGKVTIKSNANFDVRV